MDLIYLDYNGSTPVDPRVGKGMWPYLTELFGNPSAAHAMGQAVAQGVANARRQVASLLGAKPDEIIFTSGGTESNNTAIKGIAHRLKSKGRHLITSTIEHPAVLNPCRFLQRNGFELTCVGVDSTGWIDPQAVHDAIRPDTILISIMHANNEVGTIEPIAEIAQIARKAGVLMHTDAAQSVGKIPTRVKDLGVDFLSLAGHKLYAPHGIGALYIRSGVEFEPLHHGAGHEGGRRAGTEPVADIVGLGIAAEIATETVGDPVIPSLRDKLHSKLAEALGENLALNGHPDGRLPNTLNVSFKDCLSSDLLSAMPKICASAGSACHSGLVSISPVLAAMGTPVDLAKGAIRFSLGRMTTADEIDRAIPIILNAVNRCKKYQNAK